MAAGPAATAPIRRARPSKLPLRQPDRAFAIAVTIYLSPRCWRFPLELLSRPRKSGLDGAHRDAQGLGRLRCSPARPKHTARSRPALDGAASRTPGVPPQPRQRRPSSGRVPRRSPGSHRPGATAPAPPHGGARLGACCGQRWWRCPATTAAAIHRRHRPGAVSARPPRTPAPSRPRPPTSPRPAGRHGCRPPEHTHQRAPRTPPDPRHVFGHESTCPHLQLSAQLIGFHHFNQPCTSAAASR